MAELHEIKGVGPATATRLAEHGLTSTKKLAKADLDAIVAVPGFGPVRAAAVRDAARASLPAPVEAEKPEAKKPEAKKPKAKGREKGHDKGKAKAARAAKADASAKATKAKKPGKAKQGEKSAKGKKKTKKR